MSNTHMYIQRHIATISSWRIWSHHNLLKSLSTAAVLALILVAFLFKNTLPGIRTIGYGGVFILSLIGSASILVPIPGVAAVCAGPGIAKLLPIPVAILAAFGETIGEMTGYLLGFNGSQLAERRGIYPRIKHWMERRGSILIFLSCSIPNPLFDLVAIAAGTLRYSVWRFVAAVLAGKLVKSTTIAYTCFYGFDLALKFFGLD